MKAELITPVSTPDELLSYGRVLGEPYLDFDGIFTEDYSAYRLLLRDLQSYSDGSGGYAAWLSFGVGGEYTPDAGTHNSYVDCEEMPGGKETGLQVKDAGHINLTRYSITAHPSHLSILDIEIYKSYADGALQVIWDGMITDVTEQVYKLNGGGYCMDAQTDSARILLSTDGETEIAFNASYELYGLPNK